MNDFHPSPMIYDAHKLTGLQINLFKHALILSAKKVEESEKLESCSTRCPERLEGKPQNLT